MPQNFLGLTLNVVIVVYEFETGLSANWGINS